VKNESLLLVLRSGSVIVEVNARSHSHKSHSPLTCACALAASRRHVDTQVTVMRSIGKATLDKTILAIRTRQLTLLREFPVLTVSAEAPTVGLTNATSSAQPSSAQPTQLSAQPTQLSAPPTARPTADPSVVPTLLPSELPTLAPTFSPEELQTGSPSVMPTLPPTLPPTLLPTLPPTSEPSNVPSGSPTSTPTESSVVMPCLADPLSSVGDGWCDAHAPYNTLECAWDGGDCCRRDSLIIDCKDPTSPM
jgi:hypothetical protein